MGVAPIPAGPVVLRPWQSHEAPEYLRGRDATVFRFTTESPDLTIDGCRAAIEAAAIDPDRAAFAIADSGDRPFGNLAVTRLGRRAVISYWLAPAARGRGWATQALQAGSAWAEATWEVAEIELEIDAANQASRRVAEAAGYRQAGLRQVSACGGEAIIYLRP